jgi:hypothetical protein
MQVTDEEWTNYLELKSVQGQIKELQTSIGIAAVNSLYPNASNEEKQPEVEMLMKSLDRGVLSNLYIDKYKKELQKEPNKTKMKNLETQEVELETSLDRRLTLLNKIFLAKDNNLIESTLYNQMPPLLKEQFIAKEKIIASQAKRNGSKEEERQYGPRTTETIYIRKDSDEGSKINEENIKAIKKSDRINTFAPLPPPPEGMGYVRTPNGKNFVRDSNGNPERRAAPPYTGGPRRVVVRRPTTGGRKRTQKKTKKRRTNRSKRIHKFRT